LFRAGANFIIAGEEDEFIATLGHNEIRAIYDGLSGVRVHAVYLHWAPVMTQLFMDAEVPWDHS